MIHGIQKEERGLSAFLEGIHWDSRIFSGSPRPYNAISSHLSQLRLQHLAASDLIDIGSVAAL